MAKKRAVGSSAAQILAFLIKFGGSLKVIWPKILLIINIAREILRDMGEGDDGMLQMRSIGEVQLSKKEEEQFEKVLCLLSGDRDADQARAFGDGMILRGVIAFLMSNPEFFKFLVSLFGR